MNILKKDAIEALRSYEYNRMALKNLPELIESLSVEIGAKSGSWPENRKREQQERLVRYRIQFKYTLSKVNAIERALKHLTDSERAILDCCYINPVDDQNEYIMEMYGLKKSAAFDRKYKALKHFTNAMFGDLEVKENGYDK